MKQPSTTVPQTLKELLENPDQDYCITFLTSEETREKFLKLLEEDAKTYMVNLSKNSINTTSNDRRTNCQHC